MKILLFWALNRAKERSTWIGFTALLTSLGLSFSPEQIEAITTAGLGLIGLLLAFTKDKKDSDL